MPGLSSLRFLHGLGVPGLLETGGGVGWAIMGRLKPLLCQSLNSLKRPRLARAAQGALSRGSVTLQGGIFSQEIERK